MHLYSDSGGIYRPPEDDAEFTLLRRHVRKLADPFIKQTGMKGGRVLDIGCGTGALIAELADHSFDCTGIEYTPSTTEYARSKGLDVWQGNVMEFPFRESSFELIIMNHVLEHLIDPCTLLQTLRWALVPSGTLFIGVPNYLSLMARHPSLAQRLGRRRVDVFLPKQHLWYFSPSTLQGLLKKTAYRVCHVVTLTDLGTGPTVRSILAWPIGRLIEKLGWGDGIEVFARA